MKKFLLKTLALGLVLFNAFSASAQIRNYVGVVREKFSPELVSFLEECRDELKDHGYSTYAKYIDSYIAGGFGSGFVYVAADGTNYIITNRHVVSQAASASIEFENPDNGSVVKYEDLKIVATDDDIDIAILKFADNKNPFKRGLRFAANRVTDGQEVFSAGFPGLGGDPLWQLGKGSVTNGAARIKELMDPSVSTLIQHSAEIDSGNSGGPLLIQASGEASGYSVVGVNTWKAVARQNTNFAIPAKVVQNLISNYEKGTAVDAQKSASERAKKIAALLNDTESDFAEMARYVSMRAAEKSGKKSFESAVKFAPTAARNTILGAFSSSPVEGFRYSVAYELWKKYKVEDSSSAKFNYESVSKNGEKYDVVYSQGEKKFIMTWTSENGIMRLETMKFADEIEAEKEKASTKKKTSAKKTKVAAYSGFDSPTSFDINGGAVFGFGDGRSGTGFMIELDSWPFTFVGFDVALRGLPMDSESLTTINGGIVLRLPYNFSDNFCLIGIFKANGTVGIGDEVGFGFRFEGGVEATFATTSFIKPGLGITYSYTKLSSPVKKVDSNNKTSKLDDGFGNLNVYAKLCF